MLAPVISYAGPTTPPASALRSPIPQRSRWPSEARAATWVVVLTIAGLAVGTGKGSVGSLTIVPILGCIAWYVVARFARRKETPAPCLWAMYVATFWCMMWTIGLALQADGDL